MLGRILGFDSQTSNGTISGDNGTRYKFSKEDFRDNNFPQKDMYVDFEINNEKEAKNIYIVKDKIAENTNIILGLAALAITFFFAFIGTFISRVVLAKEPVRNAIIPTVIHFILTILIFIPIIGWLIYFGSTLYYMIKNYQLVNNPKV